mgnify:CR=1 FL=1
MNDDFIDLRSGNLSSESFWPSFTDIMTVIVMIFLLAMVVLLIKNMELVNELRATMEAERNAAHAVALADLDSEDGSFHPPDTDGVYHLGFDRDALRAELEADGFSDIELSS